MEAESKANVKQNEVISESLDNTVSAGKIMSFLDSRRKKIKVYKYVSSLTRQQRRGITADMLEHFVLPGNPLNAYGDDWDGGLPSGYFEALSHKSLMPQMLSEPRHTGKEDPVEDLLRKKRQWTLKAFRDMKYRINLRVKRSKPYKWMDDNVLYCPQYFVDIASHLENDPDKYFNESYNWYYTGDGNLQVATIDGANFIIHSEFNCLNMSQFFKDTMSIDQNNMVTFKCDKDTTIFETIQQLNFIVLRTKHKIIILRLNLSEDGIELEKIKELQAELPYTGISFDEHHKNILFVTSLDYVLTIVNLDRMTCRTIKLRGRFLALTDNWSRVIGSERHCFLHATGNAVTFYDKRTSEPVQRWKSLKYQVDLVECNQILAAKYCKDKPQLYLGSTHHLFLMDTRYSTTTNTKPKAVTRWTHGMRSKMTYLDIGSLDYNKDVICMASHWGPDMCYVTNYKDILSNYNELKSVCMPYRLPSFLDTYNVCQRKGLCCNLYEPVIDRLMMSVTGMTLVERGESPCILVQNSVGDISSSFLYPQHMGAWMEDDGPEKLYEWTKKLKWETKSFEATHIFDMSRLWNLLKHIPDDHVLGHQPHINRREKYSEQEIEDIYENGEVDSAFLTVWKEDENVELTLDKTDYRNIGMELQNDYDEALDQELSDDEF